MAQHFGIRFHRKCSINDLINIFTPLDRVYIAQCNTGQVLRYGGREKHAGCLRGAVRQHGDELREQAVNA